MASIETHARSDGDDYVINGSEVVDHERHAGRLDVRAGQHQRRPPHKSKSLVIIPMDTPGVKRARKLDKLGMRSSDTGEIYFDDVRVPQVQPHR